MIIAIIILVILLALSFLVIIGMTLQIKEYINKVVEPALFPCKALYVVVNFNAQEESTMTDFSRYDTEKIIFQSVNLKRPPEDEKEKLADGKCARLAPAVVYQVEDEYLWKF